MDHRLSLDYWHTSNPKTSDTKSHLLYAIRLGKKEIVRELLKSGKCSASSRANDYLSTPAIILCITGVKDGTVEAATEERVRCALLEILVQNGAAVDIVDKDHMTAALYAAERGFISCLQFLARSGANLIQEDKEGRNAVVYSSMHGHLECLKYLIRVVPKSSLDHKTKDGRTALMLAAREKKFDCLECLVAAGADINMRDNAGYTALCFALKYSDDLAVKLLLEQGSTINLVTGEGFTTLTMAYNSNLGNFKWVLKLLQKGADLTLSFKDQSFLHEMISRQQKAVVRRMVMNGCAPSDRICKEHVFPFSYPVIPISPLAVALLSKQPDVARYLIANRFLTQFDIKCLCRNKEIHHILKDEEQKTQGFLRGHSETESTPEKQCLDIFNFLAREPWSLFTLSLVTVASSLKPPYHKNPKEKIKGLPAGVHPQSFGARLLGFRQNRNGRAMTASKLNSKKSKELSRREQVESLMLPPSLKRAILMEIPASRVCCQTWDTIPLQRKRPHFAPCLCAICEETN